MTKKYDLNHISSLDFSAYGYVGASIERLNAAEVEGLLDGYAYDDELDSLNSFSSGKSLLDLALDNIDRVGDEELEQAFKIIGILAAEPRINKQEIGEDGHSFLSHAIDLVDKYKDNQKVKAFLLDKINALSVQTPDGKVFLSPLLQSKDMLKEIEILKRELGDSFLKGVSEEHLDNWLVSNILHEEDAPSNLKKIYQLSHGAKADIGYHNLLINMIEAGLLRGRLDIQLEANITIEDFIVDNLDQFKDPIFLLNEITGAQPTKASLSAETPELVAAKLMPHSNVESQLVAKEVNLPKAKIVAQGAFKLQQRHVEKIYNVAHGTQASEKSQKYKDILLDIYGEGLISEGTVLNHGWVFNTTVASEISESALKTRKSTRSIKILRSSVAKDEKIEAAKKVTLLELYDKGEPEAFAFKLNHMESGAPELNELDGNGYNILHQACFNGQTELAKKLLAKGADPFVPGDKGLNAIHILMLNNNPEASLDIFQEMTKSKGFAEKMVEAQGNQNNGFMYAMLALKNGNIRLAEELLKVPEPEHVLTNVVAEPDEKAVSLVNPDHINRIQSEIFIRAVKSDDGELVGNFLKLKANANFNPTTIAVDGAPKDMMMLLVESGSEALKATIESGNNHIVVHNNILKKAVQLGNDNAVAILLEYSKSKNSSKLKSEAEQEKNASATGILNHAYDTKRDLEFENIRLRGECAAAEGVKKEEIAEKIITNERRIKGIYSSVNKLLEHNVDQYLDVIYPDPTRLSEGRGIDAKVKPTLVDVNAAFKVDAEANKKHKIKDNILLHAYNELYQARDDVANTVAAEGADAAKLEVLAAAKAKEALLQEIFDNILNHPRADLNIPDENGQNLLMLASKYGDTHTVHIAILRGSTNKEKGSEQWLRTVNATDDLGNTAVFYAAQSGHVDALELLVFEGAVLEKGGKLIANNAGITPFMAACSGGHLNVVKRLEPKNVMQLDKKGNSALHYLAMGSVAEKPNGKEEANSILQNLLEQGADIDAKNLEGRTPLILAIINNNTDLVKELLNKGADVNAADKQGNTPLIYACLLNDSSMIESILTANDLDVRRKNNAGISANIIAIQRDGLDTREAGGKEDLLKKLNESMDAIDIRIKDIPGLHESNTYPELSKTLISRGADPYKSDPVSLAHSMTKVYLAIGAAKIANASSQVVANSLPMYGGVASEFMKVGTAVAAAAVVRSETKKAVKSFVKGWLTNDTVLDHKIDLHDVVMIGCVHSRGLIIKHGDALKAGVERHENLTSGGSAIYTVSAIKEVIDKDRNGEKYQSQEWYVNAHEALTQQYRSVQRSIDEQPWYYTFPLTWKGRALKEVARNILEADKLIADSDKGKRFLKVDVSADDDINSDIKSLSFEQVCGEGKGSLIDIMKSPQLSKQLLTDIVMDRTSEDRKLKIKEIEDLISKVVRKEISVAPDTFNNFAKFDKASRDVLRADSAKEAFLNQKTFFGYKLNKQLDKLPTIEPEAVNKFVEQRSGVINDINRARGNKISTEAPKAKSPAIVMSWLQWATGEKNAYKLRDNVGEVLGGVSGSALGAFTAAQTRPEAKTAMAQTFGAASSVAAGTISVASTIAGLAFANPAATAVVAGGVVAYRNWDTVASFVTSIGASVESLFAPGGGSKKVPAVSVDAASGQDFDTKNLGKLTPKIDEREFELEGGVDKRHPDVHKLHGVMESCVDAIESSHEHSSAIAGYDPREANHKARVDEASAAIIGYAMDEAFDKLLDGYDERDKKDIKNAIQEVEEMLIKSGVSKVAADEIIIKELDRGMKAYDNSMVTSEERHAHAIEGERVLRALINKNGIGKASKL